jgi:hypothetical protein
MGSLSLDFTSVWANATEIINSLWPIFAIPLGIVFGFGLMGKIIKEIKSAVGGV